MSTDCIEIRPGENTAGRSGSGASRVGPRTVLAVTDRHAATICEVDSSNAPGRPSAHRKPRGHRRRADDQLSPAATDFAGSQTVASRNTTAVRARPLPVEWALDEQDVYTAPLQMVKDVIIHVRQRRNDASVTVAATRITDKDPSWQTSWRCQRRVCSSKGTRSMS